jgi:acetyl-CoA/propionyl-CoA carboxylase biotin carboxyl carrier protein
VVRGDASQLRSVLMNLIDNAAKFTLVGDQPDVEVGGRRLDVVLPAGFAAAAGSAAAGAGAKKPKRAKSKKAGAAASGDSVTSPMQGTIVKVAVEEGQEVAEGDVVVVLEAMKMEQPLKAHKAGTVTGLQAEVGATVTSGAVLCELKD